MTKLACAAGLAAFLLLGAAARADDRSTYDSTTGYSRGNWPDAITQRPLTLPQGMVQLTLPVTANLTNGAAFQPVYVPAVLAYGITDGYTIALTHNTGICLSGTSNGCAKVYNDLGVDGFFALAPRGPVQLALVLGAQIPSLTDPFGLAGVVGFNSKYGSGPVALRIDPRLSIGVVQRDALISNLINPLPLEFQGGPVLGGNRETLSVPVTLQLQATPNLMLSVGSGVLAQLDPLVGSVGDNTFVPLGFGLAFTTGRADLGASFSFVNLRGQNGVSATDGRLGQVYASLRL